MNDSNISLANVSNISSVNTYCKYWEPESEAEKIAKRTAIVLLVVVGISLNIFIIVLAAKFTVRKNLHHLIINMAFSDTIYLFVMLLFCVPWLSDYKWNIYSSGTLGVIFCKTVAFLFTISCRVSLITLLIISIQRFRATRLKLHRKRANTLKQGILIIAVCWLIPIGYSIIYAYMARPEYYNGRCAVWPDDSQTKRIISFVLLFYDIILAILCCAIFILGILTTRRLAKPLPITKHLSEEQRNVRTHRTRAAVRMVLGSVLLYTFCWFPVLVYSVVELANLIIPSANIIDWSACIDRRSLSFIIWYFLPAFNSCCSPCIYVIFLSDFREATKKVLCRKETLNQAPNRENPIELQPIASPARNRRVSRRYEDQEI